MIYLLQKKTKILKQEETMSESSTESIRKFLTAFEKLLMQPSYLIFLITELGFMHRMNFV